MPTVIKYFGPTSAGAGDGTSWNDRASLLTGSGTWSTYLTGYAFSTNNHLVCRIGSGIYNVQQTLSSARFSTPPNISGILMLEACGPTGEYIRPPEPNWYSCSPVWATGNLPNLYVTGSNRAIQLQHSYLRLLSIYAISGTNLSGPASASRIEWCYIDNDYSNTNSTAIDESFNISLSNSVVAHKATNYYAVINGTNCNISLSNVRVQGNPSASAGSRYGLYRYTNVPGVFGSTFLDCRTAVYTYSFNNNGIYPKNNLFYNCVNAIENESTNWTGTGFANNNLFVGCTSGIITNPSGANLIFDNNCFINVSGKYRSTTHTVENGTYTVSGATNTSEFVSVASGNFNIKQASELYTKNIGPSIEIAQSGSGGGTANYYFIAHR